MPTHTIQIGALTRELPIVRLGGVSVALLNLLGDTALTEGAAELLAARLPAATEVLVTPEVKAVPLAHAISVRSGLPYVVVRKTRKPYMLEPITRSVVSITTGKPQDLVVDGADVSRLRGRNVVIIDDVISTGATWVALMALLAEIEAQVLGTAVVFTEGDVREEIIALGHLPLYPAEVGS